MNVYLPNKRLPNTYQEVEYIESSWTQYINTGVTVNSANRVFKLKYQINTSNNNRSVFWTLVRWTKAWPNTRFSRLDNQLEWDCYAWSWNWRITYNKSIPSWAEEYELGNNYIKDLSTWTTLVTGTASNKSRSDYIPIFWRYQSDWSYVLSSLKLYYFQIIDNWTLVRDFVPCYRKSDNVIWLYDLVNNQFYTNSWTWTFSKGNDVTMAELKNAYIGEVWTPTSSTLAYFPLANDQLDKVGNYTLSTTGTKQTIGYQFSWSNVWVMSWWWLPKMISVRAKIVSFGSWIWDCATMIRIGRAMRYNWYHSNSSVSKMFQMYNNWAYTYSSAQNTSTWNWYHIAFGISGWTSWTYACWINGNKVWSWTIGSTENGSWDWTVILMNNNSTWIFSDLILETRLWDDAEILNYYNNTKSNYWL